MRIRASGRYAGAFALASGLGLIAADTAAQTSGRSAMRVGAAEPGAQMGAAGVSPAQRGSSWGPDGYSSDRIYIYTPAAAPIRSDAPTAPRASGSFADDAVTSGGTWADPAPAAATGRDDAARGYRRVGRGFVVPTYLRDPAYFVTDWRGYGLAKPAANLRWVRYYDDALLIDATGRVQDTRYDVDWNRNGGTTTYADGGFYQGNDYDTGFAPEGDVVDDGVQVYRSGPNAPNVSVQRNPDGSTTVTVREEPQVTTTTRYVPAPPLPPPPVQTMVRRRR
jgi:Ni/Co efflux regulator RcnB